MITDKQFSDAAKYLKCEVSTIKAFHEVEALGSGFLSDGRLKTLFEGHRFWKNLIKAGADPLKFIFEHPEYSNVLYKKWDKKQYKGGALEWDRISRAIEICDMLGVSPHIAFDSASFGAFQILGENCKECGYTTSHEMVAAYNNGGETEQLKSFCELIKARPKLLKALRVKDFDTAADLYNGTASELNNYGSKLRASDKKFMGQLVA